MKMNQTQILNLFPYIVGDRDALHKGTLLSTYYFEGHNITQFISTQKIKMYKKLINENITNFVLYFDGKTYDVDEMITNNHFICLGRSYTINDKGYHDVSAAFCSEERATWYKMKFL